MVAMIKEKVTDVQHWNESLFSFKTSRQSNFTFENGHFVMMGLEIEGRPLMRAYRLLRRTMKMSWNFSVLRWQKGN